MFYLLLNNIYQIKNKWKIILAYLLCVIIYTYFNFYNNTLVKEDNLYLISLGIIFKTDFLEKLFYILNISFLIYISLNLLLSIKDIKDNILTRISSLNILLYTNTYIFLMLSVFKSIIYLIVSLITKCNFDIRVFLLDVFFNYMLILICYILVLFFKNISFSIFLFFLLIVTVLVFNRDLLFSIYYNIYILLIVDFVLGLISLILNIKVSNLFERMMLK